VGWVRWRRWRAEEQDTRLLTGIVDLRRHFRDGHLDERLPAKGRGFTRDVETAVNRLLDEASVHLRTREHEVATLAKALDLLGSVVARTVEQLETTAREIEGLGVELGRTASTAGGGLRFWEAVEMLRAGDERFAGHCQNAIVLADRSQSAAGQCHDALEHLRATLAELTREAAGTTEGVRALRAQWRELHTGLDAVAQATGTTEVLALNATLVARREGDPNRVLDRLATEADELAHDATRALARVRSVATDCEDRIHELPPHLTALATALSGVAEVQTQASAHLSAARPDAVRLADEFQTWNALARRIGSVLADAAALLTATRREAERLLTREMSA
jgi:methyl-accepting chemotaxis protein